MEVIQRTKRDDPTAYSNFDHGESKTTSDAIDSQASMTVWNIPPYDPAAYTPEKAYLFFTKSLLCIYGHTVWILWDTSNWGNFLQKVSDDLSFVSNCVNKLDELQVGSDHFL